MLLIGDPTPFRYVGGPKLVESTDLLGNAVKSIAQTGVFQNCMVVNENGRQYPRPIWEPHFTPGSPFQLRLKEREVHGRVEHPADGVAHLGETSHVITMARFATPTEVAKNSSLDEGDILGTIEPIRGTVGGNHLIALIEASVRFGVSSRGDGTVVESGDRMIVESGFNIETWDAVACPSVKRAVPSRYASLQLEVTEALKRGEPLQTILEKLQLDNTNYNQHSSNMHLKESSFVLCTGIMNDGEKLIPVQLIAEATEPKPYSWITENTKVNGLESFSDVDTAIRGFQNFCESKGIKYTLPIQITNRAEVASPIKESTATDKNMNTRDELRKIQTEVVQLGQTSTKGLKPSVRSAFFENVNDYRIKLDNLVAKDPSLRTLSEGVHKRLNEFEERLDDVDNAAPAPEMPEAAPTGDVGAEDPAMHDEPDGDEGGAPEDSGAVQGALANVEEILDILRQVQSDPNSVDKSRLQTAISGAEELCGELGGSCGGDEADPGMGGADATDPNQFGADAGDTAGDTGGDFPDNEDVVGEGPVAESRRRAIARKLKESNRKARASAKKTPYLLKVERQLGLARRRLASLEEAADALYNSFRKLSESNRKGEGSKALTEAQIKARKYESAARELAGKYNNDLLELATAYMRVKVPHLYEKYARQIAKCNTFMKLHKLAERIVSADSIVPPNSAKPIREGKEKQQKPLTESAGSDPENKGEQLHESLGFLKNARRNK